MKEIAIYFAGTIAKGHEIKESRWRDEDLHFLQDKMDPYQLHLLNPANRTDDLSDSQSVFGRDMTQVFLADLVFVDVRHRRGLGVGAEMMWAKVHSKPVLALSPKESHYRKSQGILLGRSVSEYVHPFVASLSDQIVSTLEEGAEWILKWVQRQAGEIKGLASVQEAMCHYQKNQFPSDLPMQKIISSSESIQKQFKSILSEDFK